MFVQGVDREEHTSLSKRICHAAGGTHPLNPLDTVSLLEMECTRCK
jgi:hypothetical protein